MYLLLQWLGLVNKLYKRWIDYVCLCQAVNEWGYKYDLHRLDLVGTPLAEANELSV